MKTLLELDGVAARYGPVQALSNVSLVVRESEVVAVLGANGAGKTTTLRAISGTVSRSGAIERGPGRHGISNALFLYLRDPDGHRVEIYTSDYLTVDPDFEPVRWRRDDPYRQQLWGGLAPKSWFTEGSAVRRLDGTLHPVAPPLLEGLPTYIS